MDWEERLEQIYQDPRNPGSFSGADKLHEIITREGFRVSKYKVAKWLKGKESYTIFKTPRRTFKRNTIVMAEIDDVWATDLMVITQVEKANSDTSYVLVVIDIFSRYVWLRGLPDKRPKSVALAFEDVLSEGRRCKALYSDKGGEYYGHTFRNMLKKHKIKQYFALNDKKAPHAERVILTLKRKIFRYMEEANTQEYISKLQDFAYSYNHTVHRSIGIRPVDVTKENERFIFWTQYMGKEIYVKKENKKRKNYKYKIGQLVRISVLKGTFDKVGKTQFSGEIFKVKTHFYRDGIQVYTLTDYYGQETIQGTFYAQELTAVSIKEDAAFKIDKVLRHRGKGQRREAFVQWRHWPKQYNSWVKLTDIEDLT